MTDQQQAIAALTKSQAEAVKWLADHGGDAVFDKHGVALAMGESAPHTRTTWNALAAANCVEFYNPHGKGRGRVRIVDLPAASNRNGGAA
jgi:hypothetical protein